MRLILSHQKFISKAFVQQEAGRAYIKNIVTLWGR